MKEVMAVVVLELQTLQYEEFSFQEHNISSTKET
jgi:hypothetical protein